MRNTNLTGHSGARAKATHASPVFVRARHGFTLIESLIATVVLAFCTIGICGVLTASLQNSDGADNESLAAEWARSNMERLAAKNLSDISSPSGVGTTEAINSSQFVTGDDVEVTGTVTYVNRQASQSVRDVAVIAVTATAPGGATVTLKRLVTRTEMP